MGRSRISQTEMAELYQTAKWDIPLNDEQKIEFEDLADSLYQWINDNRMKMGQPQLFETRDVVPTLADLEYIRQLDKEIYGE